MKRSQFELRMEIHEIEATFQLIEEWSEHDTLFCCGKPVGHSGRSSSAQHSGYCWDWKLSLRQHLEELKDELAFVQLVKQHTKGYHGD